MPTRRRLQEINSLKRSKGRRKLQCYAIEGIRLVEAAVDAGAVLEEVLVASPQAGGTRMKALLARLACPVEIIATQQFDQVSDVKHAQGILGVARLPDLFSEWDPAVHRRILVLDGVQDPGNVGTLVRTAAWFGIDGIVAGPETADFYQPKVARATMGGLWDVRIGSSPDLGSWLVEMSGLGYALFGAGLAGVDVSKWTPVVPSIVVVGSEAHGLSDAVSKHLDETLTIPAQNSSRSRGVESLNVATAGAILVERWIHE